MPTILSEALAAAREGHNQRARELLSQILRLDPRLYLARLHLATVLEKQNEPQDALIQYARALQDAQAEERWLNSATTPAELRDAVEHAVAFVRAKRWEVILRLLEPLVSKYGTNSLRRVERCLRIYFKEESGQSADPRQQPTFLYFPELPPAPYLNRSLFRWIEALEDQTDAIRSELLQLLPTAAPRERVFDSAELEQQNLRGQNSPPSWNGYYFFRHGQRRDENCSACPRTAAALEPLPLSRIREHGPEVLFSVFTAGTHLLPHRGVTNTRLVGHLPLMVPQDCALRVADELHQWREGQVVVFDDTYEHEAWNRSGQVRVVLIFDIWNPFLTDVERAALAELIPSFGDFRHAIAEAAV